jgi:hypothetical protein
MRFTKSLLIFVLATFAALLAASAPPCSGAPPLAAARLAATAGGPISAVASAGRARPGDSPAAVAPPPFQAVGPLGDFAVANATDLLTPAVFIQPDSGFGAAIVTGLAISPARTVFVVGNDFVGNSWLGQVNFTTGAETTVGKITGYVINDIAFDGTGHLYGLTDNTVGASPHSLLLINTSTAAVTVTKVLNNHAGLNDLGEQGAIAFNPADSSFYYADRDSGGHLFVDVLAPGTFMQTSVLSSTALIPLTAMAFSQGSLWIFSFGTVYSASASSIGAGVSIVGNTFFPTADGFFVYFADGAVPNTLPCVPSLTAACLYNRFKVEITYDATPNNGTGPANVVLESTASVKFTFFDPTNIEMILKVLNACAPPFNSWWVFAGGLTDVGVSIKVTDTTNGAFKNYSSTKGHLFQTFADTSAFACP